MYKFGKALLVVVLVSATVWPQSDAKPKADQSQAASSQGQSAEKAGPSAASQSAPASGATPAPGATPTPGATPAPGDSTTLEVIKAVRATYPFTAEMKQIQGQVLLKLTVSEKGDVQHVDIVRGDPTLAEAAVKAAKQWKFKPYIKNGKPVAIATEVPFDFAFDGRVEDAKTPPQNAKNSNAAPDNPNVPRKVRISGGVADGHIMHKVSPVYPREALQGRIEGTVLLHAIIDKEGRIVSLDPISGPKELIPASMGAVQQWRYRPYILNGEPVEVETTVTVNFHLNP